MSNTFRPSRRFRREFGHKPCPACGNRVDPVDLVVFAPAAGQTFFLHASCVEVALEAAAARPAPEEENGTGSDGRYAEVTMAPEEEL